MQKFIRRLENPDGHLTRGYYLIAVFFIAICISLLVIDQIQAYVLDSVRAYVAAEGLWSKGEKEAVFHLGNYVASGDEQDYQAFLRSIDTTLGDRQAREALQQPHPDIDRARTGFLRGGNNPADVDGMIHLFLWFHGIRFMESAIDTWTQGDTWIAKLLVFGKQIHATMANGPIDGAERRKLIGQIDQINQQLTFLEKQFSGTLGKGARWSRFMLREGVLGSVALLLLMGLGGSWRVLGSIRRTEQDKRIAAAVFDAAVVEGIVVTDATPLMQVVNPAFSRITGYDASELIGRNPSMLGSGHQDAEFYRRMWEDLGHAGQWQGEVWNRRKDGQVYPAWLSISAVHDRNGQVIRYVGVCTDITDRKEREDLIWHQAHFDILTDLPNRSLFFDRLAQHLVQARRDKYMVALLFIDLDHFKDVNDTYGHKTGDILLQLVAERLSANVRESDTVGRLSGDEFAIILSRIRDRRDTESLVRKISLNCARAYTVEGHDLTVTASIGLAVYPQDGENAETLLHRADTAMYAAKKAGRGTFRFHADLDEPPAGP